MPTNLQQAANSLALHLFKAPRSALGGVGPQHPSGLAVHVNGPESGWTGPTPKTWTPEKFPVTWRFEMAVKSQASPSGKPSVVQQVKTASVPATPSATTPKPVVKEVVQHAVAKPKLTIRSK